MSDPKRLSMASDVEFERALLRVARVPAPRGAKERALLVASSALAGSAAVAGGTAAGKGTALGLAKAGSIASLKWVGIVGLTGVGLTAGAVAFHEVRDLRPPVAMSAAPVAKPAHAARAHSRANGAPHAEDGWTPAPVDPFTIAPTSADAPAAAPGAVRAPPTVVAEAGETPPSTVPEELMMLERARSALAAGDSAGCLSALEQYAGRFPRGSMAPEGTMLRIEALVKAGDPGAARRFADAYLASDPDSPYAARVRSLLETSDP